MKGSLSSEITREANPSVETVYGPNKRNPAMGDAPRKDPFRVIWPMGGSRPSHLTHAR